MALDVIDVLVSPSSLVPELCGACSCCSYSNLVEPQSFFFLQKRVWTATQEEVRYEDSPAPAPLQNSSHAPSMSGCPNGNAPAPIQMIHGGRVRKRRGVKVHHLRQMKINGKWERKSSGVSGSHRKEW